MIRVTLPYPDAKLSPNARVHWADKASKVRAYRQACGYQAMAQGLRRIDAESLSLEIQFCPPDKRRRDRDNAIAAFKHGQDAIADVTGIDDANFTVTYAPWGNPVPGGQVIITIGEG